MEKQGPDLFDLKQLTSWATYMIPDVGLWQHRTAIPYEGETNEVSATKAQLVWGGRAQSSQNRMSESGRVWTIRCV